jgi:DNA-binding LacI/PurR family transcriptional regulator
MAREAARVGVRDVAARAGVSTQTVSRVINDHPHIRPETRERVRAAMAELGYRVNNAARSLGTATTRTLGVVASDATLYGPSVGIAALAAAARERDRWIATAYADAADEPSVRSALDHLLAQGVDGLVVLAPHARTLEIAREAAAGVPVVALHSDAGAQRQSDGAALAVDHLVALGHRRIGRLSGPADWMESTARDTGVDRGFAAHGLGDAGRWRGDWSAAAGRAAAVSIAPAVQAAGGPTAVVAANDQMALGLIAGLDAAGIPVPHRVSVVGFDDNPDAAFYRPALTTVRLDLAGEARRAVAVALGLPPEVDPDPPRLAVRSSTAPPPFPDPRS